MKTKQNYDPRVGCLYSNLSQRVGFRPCADQHGSYHARNCTCRPDEFIVGAKSMNEILEEYYTLGYLSCDTRPYRDWETDRKSTRLNSSHRSLSRMPSSA